MANGSADATKVRLAPTGHVYIAAIGSAAPTNSTTALTSAWTDLGYVDENGVSVMPKVDTTPYFGWQSTAELIRSVDKTTTELKFVLEQTTQATTSLYYMGQAWVMNPSGVASLSLTTNPTLASLMTAMVVDWTDDKGQISRMYVPRGMITDRQEIKLHRKNLTTYGVTFVAFDNSGSYGTIFSNSTDLYSS